MITAEKKRKAMAGVQLHKDDVGSPQVQVASLTERIKEITEHLKVNKQDKMARRGLIQLVGKRRRLLDYLARKDFDAYQQLIAKLGLRK